MTRETQEAAAKPARTIKDEWSNSLKGYGLTAWLAAAVTTYRDWAGAELAVSHGFVVAYAAFALPLMLALNVAFWLVVAAYRRLARKIRDEA